MSSALEILLEMGFPINRAKKALVLTGNQGAEIAMEWLLVHENDPSIDEPLPKTETVLSTSPDPESTPAVVPLIQDSPREEPDGIETLMEESLGENDEKSADLQTGDTSASAEVAKSVKCDECGKLFKSTVEIEFHAVKSGHQSFSESTEAVKPLTEEEKREKVRKLEEKIKLRRMTKEAEEKREQIEKEKARRRTGQEIIESKKRLEDEEMKRIAEQRRKEKMEEKLARQRVLEQIERDKEARKIKFGMAAASSAEPPTLPSRSPVVPPMAGSDSDAAKKEYTHSKLQIRLTNGEILTQSFGSKEELAAVRVFIQMNRTDGSGPFNLMTSFPKKLFTEEDMEKPLYQLGLVPSAVLILIKASIA